jgi:hypothetical protein
MIEFDKMTQETYFRWHNVPYVCDPKRLALALRRALAEVLQIEFWRVHRESREWDCEECRDRDPHPRHRFADADWQQEAHRQLMGEIGK